MKAKENEVNPAKLESFCAKNQMVSLDFHAESPIGKSIFWFFYYIPIPFLLKIIDRWLDNVIEHSLLYNRVTRLEACTHIRIEDVGGLTTFVPFGRETFETEHSLQETYYTFVFNTVRFVFDEAERTFVNLQERFQTQRPRTIVQKFRFGRYTSEISNLWQVYGKNEMFVEPPQVFEILFKESFSMMGVVETICLTFLFLDSVWMSLIATSILVLRGRYLAVVGAFASYESNTQQVLKKSQTLVIRRNEEEEYQKMSVNSESLVPGDIIEITKGQNMTVDALLISGSCIFNEEGITGITVNQIKYPYQLVEGQDGPAEAPRKHQLLAGSTCVYLRSEINEGCLAIVTGTGYNTFKGKLLRELLMPKKVVFESFNQAMSLVWFLSSLFVIGVVLFVSYALTHRSNVKLSWYDILDVSFNIFVSTVKPCLPYCLFMGIQSSEDRLKALGVESTNNFKINQSARCKTIIFDKTGTLTTNNNKVASIVAIENLWTGQGAAEAMDEVDSNAARTKHAKQGESIDQFRKMLEQGMQGSFEKEESPKDLRGPRLTAAGSKISDLIDKGPEFNLLVYNLNFNNSLLKVGKGLVGDELDLELYRFCPYELQFEFDPKLKVMVKNYYLKPEFAGRNDYPESFTVLWTFDYDSDLKRSSIIVKSARGEVYLLTKGAPEEVVNTCAPESLPDEYSRQLFHLTSLGYRLIGFGTKRITESEATQDRSVLERNLSFQGLITNESFLREQAIRTVKNLGEAQIRLIMATGDNMFTGISVGQKTGLIQKDMVVYTLHEFQSAENPDKQELYFVNFTKLTNSQGGTEDKASPQTPLADYDTPDITQDILTLANSKRSVVFAATANAYEELMSRLGSLPPNKKRVAERFIRNRGLIYARCTPVQKRRLIEHVRGYERSSSSVVMFVGDEANDAEAIEAADVSFLMKRSHLSFRASFTSRTSDFSAVEALIREGRCSSESGFLTFKFFIFMTSLQLVSMFFLLQYFLCLNPAQNIVLDVLISLFFSDYINSFQATHRLGYTAPNSTMFNLPFMSSLGLHCAGGALAIVLGYLQLKKLSFYQTPFAIIPYIDQTNFNMSLDVHKVYEGTFFFNAIILLQLLFFMFTNLKSRYRVSLLSQKDSLYYTLFCVSLFFHLATLSEIDEPSFADQILIRWFNIGKTFGLIWIYMKMLLMYCCLAYLIEVGVEIVFAYNSHLKFHQKRKEFVQCPASAGQN